MAATETVVRTTTILLTIPKPTYPTEDPAEYQVSIVRGGILLERSDVAYQLQETKVRWKISKVSKIDKNYFSCASKPCYPINLFINYKLRFGNLSKSITPQIQKFH